MMHIDIVPQLLSDVFDQHFDFVLDFSQTSFHKKSTLNLLGKINVPHNQLNVANSTNRLIETVLYLSLHISVKIFEKIDTVHRFYLQLFIKLYELVCHSKFFY